MTGCNVSHKNIGSTDNNHSPIWKEFPNAATRLSAHPFKPEDRFKMGVDLDTLILWYLIDPENGTWIDATNSTLPPNLDVKVSISSSDTTAGFLNDKLTGIGEISTEVLDPEANEKIVIKTTAENNTGENVGNGAKIFKDKANKKIRFKSLKSSDSTIKIIEKENEIDLTANTVIPDVSNFASLPENPTIGAKVFYIPFGEYIRYDGADWVGSKREVVWFGRRGNGNFNSWARSVGETSASPEGGITKALYLPRTGGGCGYKIYRVTAKSDESFSGSIEIHQDALLNTPLYSTTGKAKADFSNEALKDQAQSTPKVLESHAQVSCFIRRTGGKWNDVLVSLTIARVARSS